jgi:Sec7-like guanine-nucleotide exchange factor
MSASFERIKDKMEETISFFEKGRWDMRNLYIIRDLWYEAYEYVNDFLKLIAKSIHNVELDLLVSRFNHLRQLLRQIHDCIWESADKDERKKKFLYQCGTTDCLAEDMDRHRGMLDRISWFLEMIPK